MKKIIALLSVLMLSILLCACGKTMTKEEMMESALKVDQYQINNDSVQNAAKAKSLYCDAVLWVEGTVMAIEEDHFEMGTQDWRIDVYLPAEELMNLRNKQTISVVGKTKKDTKKVEYTVSGHSGTSTHYVMSDAYLVQDKFELTGKIMGTNASYGGFNFKVGDSSYLKVLHFDESVDRSNAKVNEDGTITVRGILCDNHIYDAVIVE